MRQTQPLHIRWTLLSDLITGVRYEHHAPVYKDTLDQSIKHIALGSYKNRLTQFFSTRREPFGLMGLTSDDIGRQLALNKRCTCPDRY